MPFELRIKVANMAAPFVHPKPRNTCSNDPAGSMPDAINVTPMTIEQDPMYPQVMAWERAARKEREG